MPCIVVAELERWVRGAPLTSGRGGDPEVVDKTEVSWLNLCLKIKYTVKGVISQCASLPTLCMMCIHLSEELSCVVMMEELQDRVAVTFEA